MGANLYQILERGFASRRDEDFLRLPESGTAWTYDRVVACSRAQASLLREQGLGAGDRLVAQIEKSPEAIGLYLACLRLGAIYVPLNVGYGESEVGFALRDAAAHTLVCRPEDEAVLAGRARRLGVARVHTLGARGDGTLADRSRASGGDDAIAARAPDDVAALLYTSGTTGRPKGAMLTHGGLAANARALHACWGWRGDDVLLHALPIFHVHGLFVALHCAMLSGSPVIFLPRFEVAAVRAALPDATVLMGVPTFYTRLLACEDFGRADCASMRLFVSGSAPLGEATFRAFEERTGHRILERYGMTETAILTSNPLDGERLAGSVGYPLPGVELRVVDERGGMLGSGQVGQLEVRSPSSFAGYWGLPEKTRAAHRDDGFFRTGDIGSLAADDRLTLVGRASDLVISGGYNVYPKEIELCLDEVEGVVESAVVGVPHPDLGEAAVAFLVCRDGAAPSSEVLRAAMDARLARFKQPRRFYFVEALPRNAMGKVQKAELRRGCADAFEAGTADPA